jgi:hypothetical protein
MTRFDPITGGFFLIIGLTKQELRPGLTMYVAQLIFLTTEPSEPSGQKISILRYFVVIVTIDRSSLHRVW